MDDAGGAEFESLEIEVPKKSNQSKHLGSTMTPGTGAPSSVRKQSVLDHRQAIQKINKSTQLLKQELSIEYRESREVLAPEKISTLKQIQRKSAAYTRKIEQEKKRIVKLENQISSKMKQLQTSRQNSSLVNEKRESAAANFRRMQSLENRLEKCLVKKNEIESFNAHLISEVDKVGRDRVVFDTIYKKLEKELFDYENLLRRAHEDLDKAITLKNKTNEEIAELQQTSAKEDEAYNTEFIQLRDSINKTTREAEDHIRQVEQIPEDKHVSGELSVEEERNINRVVATASWQTILNKHTTRVSSEQTQGYEAAFNTIYEMTKLRDPQEVARELTRYDSENYQLFKYVENLNDEIKEMESKILLVQAEVEHCKAQEGIATSSLQKREMRKMAQKLEEVEASITGYDTEMEVLEKEMSTMKSSVLSVYNMLAHNSGKVDERLGNHGVTDSNMLDFLSSIELYTADLLVQTSTSGNLASNAQFNPKKAKIELIGSGPAVLAEKRSLSVNPPSLQDVVEEGEVLVDSRPLSHDELLNATKRSIE